jgi:hypothetical protein
MTYIGRFFSALTPAKMRGTGGCHMSKSAIVGWPKRPWADYVATLCAALLIGFAAAGPARSADYYPYGYGPSGYGPAGYGPAGYGPSGYGPSGYGEGVGYRPRCSTCGCGSCGCGPCGCTYRCGGCGSCYPKVHRSPVVERHWVEREYYERRSPGPCCRPYAYSGYPYPDYSGGLGWPRPHLGWGGIAAPISYDYDLPPRPPVGIPMYYDAGYAE